MVREKLSLLEDWKLEEQEQDLRGRELVDEHGYVIGTIEEMIVDTEKEQIVAVVLDNGVEVPVRDVATRGGHMIMVPPTTVREERVELHEYESRLHELELRVRESDARLREFEHTLHEVETRLREHSARLLELESGRVAKPTTLTTEERLAPGAERVPVYSRTEAVETEPAPLRIRVRPRESVGEVHSHSATEVETTVSEPELTSPATRHRTSTRRIRTTP